MSKYSDPITATGSLITFDAPSGGVFDSLSVPITPIQDLHGYANPWPAGGGVNKFNIDAVDGTPDPTTGSKATSPRVLEFGKFYKGLRSDNYYYPGYASYTISGGVLSVTNRDNNAYGAAYTVEVDGGEDVTVSGVSSNGIVSVGWYDSDWNYLSGSYAFDIPHTFKMHANAKCAVFVFRAPANTTATFSNIQIEKGSTAHDWQPYSNICPISGRTGLSVYVSPTSQQAQATEYAVSFGSTVYAGFADPITGEVKERPQYPSYNGEVLVGPWLSSMDEYAVGVTPTTGAQVVDLGGALATASITPVAIPMREGSNNVWVDTSAVITLIYRILQVDRQTDRTSIGKRAESLDVLGKFSSISKVEVNVTENLFYEAGDSSGRTLTVDCPFGTQAMANNLLAMLQGYVYQPFEARRSIANPATELGDGVTVGDVYGGIYAIYHKCGPLHLADLSAPADEEIDHEYKFTPAFERKVERRLNNMQSELSVQAGEIAAKVDEAGGSASNVSWVLNSQNFKVKANGADVLTVDRNGLTVQGDGNFTGNVYAGNIRYGGSAGTMSGNGITSRSIGTGRLTSGINTSLGNADYAADVFAGAVIARYMKASSMTTSGLNFMGNTMLIYKKTVKDGNGNNITLKYLGTL